MQTIELECPSCGELLELDTGFAGGVCRCSSCSTLMTVPADAMVGGEAEALSRPDRPEMPGEAMSAAPSDAERPSTRRSSTRRPAGRGKSKRKTKGNTGKSNARGERIEQGEYVTASGKTVKIDRAMRVPTAGKRRTGVRIVTVVVFFAIVLGVVGGGVLLVILMLKDAGHGNTPDAQQVDQDPTQFDYRKSQNPYTLDQPNIAGLPMHGKSVAIVVDVSDDSEFWIESMADMLATGLTRRGGEAVATIYAATPGRAHTHSGSLGASSLLSFFSDLDARGDSNIGVGIRRAFSDADHTPDMLVIIASHATDDEVAEWEGLLSSQGETEVQVIIVNGFANSDLRNWLKDREGSQAPISLSGNQILDWQDESPR